MKDEVVGGDRPADAADQLLDHRHVRAGVLEVEGDAVAIPLRRNLTEIAGADVHEVLDFVQPAVLAFQHADVPTHVVLVEDAVVAGQELVAAESIADTLDGVVAVGVGAAITILQDLRVLFRVKDCDVLRRQRRAEGLQLAAAGRPCFVTR